MKQSEKARERNRAFRSRLRSAVKELRSLEGSAEDISSRYRDVSSLLDRAASKGLLHKKTADRTKSRLAKAIHKPV